MRKAEIVRQIFRKKSFLCVGLDTDLRKIPPHLLATDNPILEFNKQIISATQEYCVAYKINTAFYESQGNRGWTNLRETIAMIPEGFFIIADAKRGDIGNTSSMYARAFYEELNCHAMTLSPYMGEDSIRPFLEFNGKWSIILGLTSNKGSADFQQMKLEGGKRLFEHIIQISAGWGSPENTMFVIGATHPKQFEGIRKIIPDHFLLVPGIGAQGGDLEGVCRYGMNRDMGLLINSSRGIIYAGKGEDFASKAAEKAKALQRQMESLL